jgi:TonB-linked SusC/RagA family outer membrane protein
MALRHLAPALVGCLLIAVRLGAQAPTTGAITGRVVDSTSQQPVPGVNVLIEGTQRGGQTRDDGTFTIGGVPAGTHRVRAARIGYAPQLRDVTVTPGTTVSVQFSLARQAAVLSEVVVTGYGTQRREAISGSVATVDAEAANKGVIANPNQMLQGRVAGVSMTTNNGEPGAGMQIRVRGGTSISASNEPLYVIDGVPLQSEGVVAEGRDLGGIDAPLNRSPLNTINPADIQSITVLKDASATAIYGSRGANGVVLIETKRGTQGTGSLQYDTYVSAASPAKRLEFLTGDQYRAFIQQVRDAAPVGSTFRTQREAQLANQGTASTDWQDEVTRNAYATNHNVSFSGGSSTTQYLASLNYFKQQGVAISSGLTRYQGRLNGQHQAIGGRLRLDLNLTAARVNNDYLAFENGGGFEGGVFTNVAVFNPTYPVRRASGQYYEIACGPSASECAVAPTRDRNPVALAEQIIDQAPENRILGNLTGSCAGRPRITAETTGGRV